MPRDEADIVAEREEFLSNRIDELLVISAWEVGPSDGAPKEYVADLRQTILDVDEHHVSGGMPRTMQHLQLLLAHADGIALLQPLIGLEISDRRKTECLTLGRQGLNQKRIVGMWTDDWQPKPPGEIGARAHMIQMTMGQEDAVGLKVQLGDQREDAFRFAAGIDDGGTPGALTPEQGAVLLERGDGQDAEIHVGARGQAAMQAASGSQQHIE